MSAFTAIWNVLATPLGGLLLALGAFGSYYILYWWSSLTKAKPRETGIELGTGFVTNFFDTLGIGSFAPTTAIFKFFKIVPDRLIPGTLNVGHTLPTITQAFIFTLAVDVEITTLVLMIAAAVIGAWLGAGVVARMPKRQIQIGMGVALLVAAGLFTRAQLMDSGQATVDGDGQTGSELRTTGWTPNATVLTSGTVFTIDGVRLVDAEGRATGLATFTVTRDVVADADGKAVVPVSPAIVVEGSGRTVSAAPPKEKAIDVGTLGLSGARLAVGLVGNLILGALMTLGIGLYAPCMILVGLLGMNARTAFPIMMGSCAFLMPVSSAEFIRKDAYSPRAALALGLGGVPAVLIAALLVRSLPLYWVKWLVVGVVFIAATMMLRSAAKNE